MTNILKAVKDKMTNVLLTPGSTIADEEPIDNKEYDKDYDSRTYDYEDYDYDYDYDDYEDDNRSTRNDRGGSRDREYSRRLPSRSSRDWDRYTTNNEPAINPIIVRYPRTISDCLSIVKSLKENKAVIISIASTVSQKDAQRIIDFLSGVVTALEGGKIRKMSDNENVYILTPPDVDIDLQDIKNNKDIDKKYRSNMLSRR